MDDNNTFHGNIKLQKGYYSDIKKKHENIYQAHSGSE